MPTPETISFTKMQGVGNDFVLVDARSLRDLEWAGLAIEICRRRLGIGADGLLVIDQSSIADAAMRMFNPDGTPNVCGNGLRCVARYLADHDDTHPTNLRIATLAGLRDATILEDGTTVTVDMGRPRFAPDEIPMRVSGGDVIDYPLMVDGERIQITALSTGSTHSVIVEKELPDDPRFERLSPRIERHPLFPDRTTVLWTKVHDRSSVEVRIWERGVGETLGCGTGACAVAVAGIRRNTLDSAVTVISRGGELQVDWRTGGSIRLTGPAEYVFEGVYPLDSDGKAA